MARWGVAAARERIQGSSPATEQESIADERPNTPRSTGLEDTPEQSDASDAPAKAVKASGRKKRAARKRA